MERPAWIAFDLYGTLLDPAGLLDDQHADLAQAALDDAVLQAMADTLTGEHRPFPEHLRAALERRLLVAGLGDAVLDAAMERARALPAFHDAAVALEILASGGYRIAVVTNSAADAGRTALAAAGLNGHIEAVVGADEAGALQARPARLRSRRCAARRGPGRHQPRCRPRLGRARSTTRRLARRLGRAS
jgi:2-haloacid dehalogenase